MLRPFGFLGQGGLGGLGSLAAPTVTWSAGPSPALNIDTLGAVTTGWHLLIKVDDDSGFGSPAINVDHTITSGEDTAFAVSGILSGLPAGTYWAEVAIKDPSGTTSAYGVTPDTYTVTGGTPYTAPLTGLPFLPPAVLPPGFPSQPTQGL